ncbi:MAG: FadR/GntR family transcriptional regulator [Egibacteraceae bacterium]
MVFERIDRQRVHEQVAARIRDAIFSGEFGPGEQLPTERELSASFGVSRASVREAMRALEAQGLLMPGPGSQFPPLVADDLSRPVQELLGHLMRLQRVRVEDLSELRRAVEPAAVMLAASDPNEDALGEARSALQAMQEPEVTVLDFRAADLRFHIALVAASRNEAMHLIMLAVRHTLERRLAERLSQLDDPRHTFATLITEHQQLLDAVERGDGAHAAELVRGHIERFYGSAPRS